MRVEQSLLLIDVESTGPDYRRHACIELAGILVDKTLQPVREFTSLIAPRKKAEHAATMQTNGISKEDLANALPMETVLPRFIGQMCSMKPLPILTGWNVWHDALFLRDLYERCSIEWPFGDRMLDIQSIQNWQDRIGSLSLGKAIETHFNERQPHRALQDARYTLHLLQGLAKKSFA